MRIAVCLKQVPDTGDLRLDPETNTLIREGVASVLNPLDAFPLEAALQLREAYGGSITAFTMGPPQAAAVLHKAVATGADRGILVSDKAFAGADTWATSLTLTKALQRYGPFDTILCGKQAIDGDTGQVGPGIAAHLGFAQITYVTGIEPVDEKTLSVTRMLDEGTAEVLVQLPAVLTVLKEANEPRLPNLADRIRAYNTEYVHATAEGINLPAEETGLEGSPTRVVTISVPEAQRTRKQITGDPAHCADELSTELQTRFPEWFQAK